MNTLFTFPKPLTNSPHHHRLHHRIRLRSTTGNNNNTTDTSNSPVPPLPQSPQSSSEGLQIKFNRGSRKRRARKEKEEGAAGGKAAAAPAKAWEEMTVKEKAVELYVGEKGLLYWINKFAYASIYIVIGAWIIFRFVGPALNLYQLDTPPLSPAAILK